jgi:hypothetical protein
MVVPLVAVTFFCGAALHAGVNGAGLDGPTIVPAVIGESACGAALAFSSYAVFGGKVWWRNATITSHTIARA